MTGKNTTTGSSSNSVTIIPDSEDACLELTSGVISFISSVVGSHCIRTPLIDAGIDGTEAIVAVDPVTGASFVLVREGVVTVTDRRSAASATTQLRLTAMALQQRPAAFATPDQTLILATPENVPPIFRELLLNPEGATDWAVYFPPILLAAGTQNADVQRAARLLDQGDPAGAEALLKQLSLDGFDKGAALSLRTIIALYLNRTEDGVRFAEQALAAAPGLGASHIAVSYAEQAVGNLPEARDAAENAIDVDPGDAYGWARLAELEMTIGNVSAARTAASRSLAITETALAHAVMGLAALSRSDIAGAEASFTRGIAVDSEAPLPRLGLGLTRIRDGELDQGLLEIETAVALDPRRAALRTWLGRAYAEGGDAEKALSQFELATEADPDDPNAFLFRALVLYGQNRPIAALDALEQAQRLGDRRGTVRSTTGLGEDRAVRGAALGRIYDVLGLEQRALAAGAASVAADPRNPEARRFLGNIFRTQRDSEIMQTSELLMADLLSPPSKTPYQLQLAETDLALLETSGPTRITFSEFGPAFESNGFRLDLSGVVGSFGNETAVTVLQDNVSISLGQLFFEDDGFRANNDIEQKVFGGLVKFAVSERLTLLGEYRNRQTQAGDRELDFFGNFDPTFRQTFDREFFRFGFNFEAGAGTNVLGAITGGSLSAVTTSVQPGFFVDTTNTVNEGEEALHVQTQMISDLVALLDVGGTVTLGGSFARTDVSRVTNAFTPGFVTPPPFPPIPFPPNTLVTSQASVVDHINVYAYLNLEPFEGIEVEIGGSYDLYDDEAGIGTRSRFNPKFGLRLTPMDRLEIRAAYTQTLTPRLVTNQLLEPTSIMGFQQYVDTINGAYVESVGIAFDAEPFQDWRIGGSAARRVWDSPAGGVVAPETQDFIVQGYVQRSFGDRISLSIGAYHESAESDFLFDVDDFRLTSFPITARFFDPSGFFIALDVEPAFHRFTLDNFAGNQRGSDQFVVVNLGAGFRLPDDLGIVSLEAQNLLDDDIRVQDRSFRRNIFTVPRFAPDLTIMARGTLQF
ncbi:MAG: TonB-dependent receptor [Pseudomonadota bacterium]